MATAIGPENPDVTGAAETFAERWPIAEMLDHEPYRFEFFQAVRLLARMQPERQVVGRFTNPEDEVLRFGSHAEVSFPASEIQSLERSVGVPSQMRVNFMGLTGPSGLLPLAYSELILERLRSRDHTLRDFFDVFNHRMISLFYQAWEKYRFQIPYERGERDHFSHHVLALLGLGTPGLQDRQNVPDDSLLFYSGLLGGHARSATGLRQLVADYFGVPVEIEQFVGAWYPVEVDSQCSLGEAEEDSQRLGFGAVVGDEIWDQQSRVRIQLGPLRLEQYMDFLPGRDGYKQVRALAGFYAGEECDVEIQLILRKDDVPACELTEGGAQLGWTSWAKTGVLARDPDETVLEL